MYGIVCTIQDIISSLYDLRPPCFSHHTHYIGHRVHCICVIPSTVLVISHQMYLWDHIRYNSRHHIQSLCHHTWVLTIWQTLYMKPHPVCRATYTLYMRPHSHYLCPHTIDNMIPSLCMTSHLTCVWHRLLYTRHHILTFWPQTTVFFSSHALYWTSCPLDLCHHLHCIDEITPNISLRSHLL